MKRHLTLLVLCAAVSAPASGIDVTARHGDRIGVLTTSGRHAYVTERRVELIDRYDLRHRRTTVAPTGIAIGRPFFGWIALPFVQRAQSRAVARDVARDAAGRIAAGAHGR